MMPETFKSKKKLSTTWSETNHFLQGPLQPINNEYVIPNLRVIGEIPKGLNGTFYRNGSNQHSHPFNADRFHWFDGDGMIHAFHLQEGRASYCNRWVYTDGLNAELAAGRALYNGIFGRSGVPQGELPEGAPAIKNSANTNVIELGGRILALMEAGSYYHELDAETLETLGKFYFDKQVQGMLTAHPHEDPRTGEMLFYSLDYQLNRLLCFAVKKSDGQLNSLHTVPLTITPFIHDFIFTTDYFVFNFGPIQFNPQPRVPKGESAWSYEHLEAGRILLVHRKTGQIRWFEFPMPIFVGHYLNAYQDGQKIIVDCAASSVESKPQDTFNVDDIFPYALGDTPSPLSKAPYLCRITIDIVNGKVKHERQVDFPVEFVRVNESILGVNHRFGFMEGVHSPHGRGGFNCLVKHDYQTGKSLFQNLTTEYDMIPGEPVFVPKSNAKNEEDGWILSVWYDPRVNASQLIILDAADFDGEPVARILLDHRVPLDFHGNWIPANG